MAPDRPITIWAITEGRVGDDRQAMALALALGATVREIRSRPSLARVALDRCADLAGPRRPEGVTGPWPDAVVVVGGRNVSLAKRIRHASGGRSRVILIGRPWWSAFAGFDLIVTTPQYGLPAAANVISNPLPLNAAGADRIAAAAKVWGERFSHLPRPWVGVLVGGPSGSCRMGEREVRDLAQRIDAAGGSPLLVASSRTPTHLATKLFESVRGPGLRYGWRPDDGDNPYLGVLALADRFLVTGESASMIAEAVNTGRPVEIVPLPLRPLARVLAGLGGSWCHGLVRRGLWVPARDMRRLHRAAAGLAQAGRSVDLDLDRTAAHIGALIGARPDTSSTTSKP